MIACRSPDRDPDGSQPRSIRRQLPPVKRQRGTHSGHRPPQLDGRAVPRKKRTGRERSIPVGQCQSHDGRVWTLCPATSTPVTAVKLSSFDDFMKWPHHCRASTHGLPPIRDFSAHAAPLVKPTILLLLAQHTGTRHFDETTPSPEDWILFRMFQRTTRTRLASKLVVFFDGGALPCHPKLTQKTPVLLWVAFLGHRNCASPGPPGR
ncbi:hypothetical protein QBC39DRAFT_360427 [Podospora conica]|nr:hypothetical protein QBC39DRAFT_360427 [Schizothecium conicum]